MFVPTETELIVPRGPPGISCKLISLLAKMGNEIGPSTHNAAEGSRMHTSLYYYTLVPTSAMRKDTLIHCLPSGIPNHCPPPNCLSYGALSLCVASLSFQVHPLPSPTNDIPSPYNPIAEDKIKTRKMYKKKIKKKKRRVDATEEFTSPHPPPLRPPHLGN